MDFSRRSYQKELLDEENIPFEDIRRNMDELNTINSLLGGHRITISGVKRILGSARSAGICEIGCGGGDNLFAISQWAEKKSLALHYSGIDINTACTQIAADRFKMKSATFVTADYKTVRFAEARPAVIFSSLFCHHFADDELVQMLKWMRANSTLGFFINDLHRHFLAYHSIRLLTRLFSRSYLVKNDAPVSVLRGFKRNEWKSLLQKAGIRSYDLKWRWAFRWLIIVNHSAE